MTETHARPEQDIPAGKGSRLRGILGAFLGAFLGAYLCDELMFFLPEELGSLVLLGNLLLAGRTACWGYRLLRGYRSMRFAQWTVRFALLQGQLLALTAALIYRKVRWFCGAGMTIDLQDMQDICLQTAEFLLDRDSLAALGMLVIASLFFCRLSWGALLKYVDPGWYSDPRRLARMGGGGATFNMPPCWPLPAAEHIPAQFEVDRGKLLMKGDTITVKKRGKAPRSFSVGETAGVVLGVSSGYNILYNRKNQALARFAWSRKNAVLFGQYLIRHTIPFIDPNGDPVPAEGQTAGTNTHEKGQNKP